MRLPRPVRSPLGLSLALAVALALPLVPALGCRGGARAAAAPAPAEGLERYLVDDFEGGSGALDPAWRLEPFDGVPETRYELEVSPGASWLHAESDGAAALLTRPVNVDAAVLPRLTWRWRVELLPEGGDPREKDADDCAARVFVSFAYDPESASLGERLARSFAARDLPGSALCYVWDASLPVGTSLPNPHAPRTRVIVVRSGPADPERWFTEQRDVAADYRAAFDREPPRVTGVAVMVDADQTGARAAAAFDELAFLAPGGAALER